jgi:hypothetical protein
MPKNGDLNVEVVPFILLLLMTIHPDVKTGKSDMEHLAEELAVVILFSPKYHREIAGKRMETCHLPLVKKCNLDEVKSTEEECLLLLVTPV